MNTPSPSALEERNSPRSVKTLRERPRGPRERPTGPGQEVKGSFVENVEQECSIYTGRAGKEASLNTHAARAVWRVRRVALSTAYSRNPDLDAVSTHGMKLTVEDMTEDGSSRVERFGRKNPLSGRSVRAAWKSDETSISCHGSEVRHLGMTKAHGYRAHSRGYERRRFKLC